MKTHVAQSLRRIRTPFTLSLLAAAMSTAWAEEIPVFTGETVVVTATRFEQPAPAFPVNVTVLNRRDIAASPAGSLAEILAGQVGVLARSADGTEDMEVDLRGFGKTGTQNTVVMVDGQRLNDPDLSAVKWSAIPLESIERIEIVRGGGAVLYGGGASGGTINIVTRAPAKGTSGNVGLLLGSYGTQRGSATVNLGGERVGLRLTASEYSSDHYRVNNRETRSNVDGDLRLALGDGEARLKFATDRQTLRFPGVRLVDPTLNIDQLATDRRGATTPNDYGTNDGWRASLGVSQRVGEGEVAAELAWRNKQQKSWSDTFGGSYQEMDLDVVSFSPRARQPFNLAGRRGEWVAGLDLAEWNYDSRRSTSPSLIGTPLSHMVSSQHDRAVYAQATLEATAATTLSAGWRRQRVDISADDQANLAAYARGRQGHALTAWDLGFRHALGQGWAVFGKTGRSFRIATVDEVYDRFGGPFFDSIVWDLEPQTSRDHELGLDLRAGRGRFRATWYRMDLENELHYNALLFRNMNLSPTRREGLELEAGWNAGSTLELKGSLALTRATFREGNYGGVDVAGKTVPLVPEHQFKLGAVWRPDGATTLSGEMVHVGSQYFDNDQANSFGQKIPAYTTVDVKLAHQRRDWTFSAAVHNLLNERYFTYGVRSLFTPGRYNAYPMAERHLALSAEYAFR